MSLIFHRFDDLKRAEAFEKTVKQNHRDRATRIWMNQDKMQELEFRQLDGAATPEEMEIEADVFPWTLDPPIVLVARNDSCSGEEQIKALVSRFGGVFAGT